MFPPRLLTKNALSLDFFHPFPSVAVVLPLDPDAAPPVPQAAEVQPEDGAVARRGAGRKARLDLPPLPVPAGQHQDVLGNAGDCSAGTCVTRLLSHCRPWVGDA